MSSVKLVVILMGVFMTGSPALAERGYNLYAVDSGIDEKDSEYFGEKTWMNVRTVNKTMNVFEWDYELLQDLPASTKSTWMMMEKVKGEYRQSSIKGAATVCEDLHSKRATIKAMAYPKSTLPKNCPIKKGMYSLRNNVPNSEFFPAIIPGDEWRISNTWTVDGKTIFKFHMDSKIDRTKKLQG